MQHAKPESLKVKIAIVTDLFGKVRYVIAGIRARFSLLSVEQQTDIVRQSGLFDSDLYMQLYPEAEETDPVLHFFSKGAEKGYISSRLFSAGYYTSKHPKVKNITLNPLIHYMFRGRRRQVSGIGEDERRFLEEATPLLKSEYWDQGFYLSSYPEVASLNMHPLHHYLRFGAGEGKDPSARFSTSFYFNQYPDVKRSGINPLLHYIKFGKAEGRFATAGQKKAYEETHIADVRSGRKSATHFFIDRIGYSKTAEGKLFYLVVEGWFHAGINAVMPDLVLITQESSHQLRLRKKRADVLRVLGEQPFYTGFSEVFSLSPDLGGSIRIADRNSGKVYYTNRLEDLKETRYASEEYISWLKSHELNKRDFARINEEMSGFNCNPLISILMPVYNPELPWLKNAVASVEKQLYNNWELCIVDDASTNSGVTEYLKTITHNQRFRVKFRKHNGHISKATNDAAKMAKGEYLLFLDHDDELLPEALFEIVKALQHHPNADIVYADQDHLSISGERYNPVFKPDFSYFMLLSSNYFNHPTVVRKQLFRKIGGLRKGFEGAQDFDMLLRMLREGPEIYHIPKILYSWRLTPGSVSTSIGENSHVIGYSKTAIEHHLKASGFRQSVYRPEFSERLNLSLFQLDLDEAEHTIEIIVPAKNNHEVLGKCIDSILRLTVYQNYRIMIIDYGSDEFETHAFLKNLPNEKIRVVEISGKTATNSFSQSQLLNEAAKLSDAEYLLFLDDDIELIEARWLNRMLAYAVFDDVGAVGARLYDQDDHIKHAGIVLNLQEEPRLGYAFSGLARNFISYCDYAEVSAEKTAVTAACMLTKRNVFIEMNGFDEDNFPEACNDVDYCLRLIKQGYKVVYCPGAELYHYGFNTSDKADDRICLELLYGKYGRYKDPYYNPNLQPDGSFRLKTGSDKKVENETHIITGT